MGTRVVEIEGDRHSHIVRLGQFFSGEEKSLCGRKPFPERWGMLPPGAERKPMCPNCGTRYRERR